MSTLRMGISGCFLLLWATSLCAVIWPLPPAPDSLYTGRMLTLPDRPDPHGDYDACLACHLDEGAASREDIRVESCRDCHDASAHHRRIHPVDCEISSKIHVPDSFPLIDGKLDCITCHGMICDPERSNRAMLRGAPFPRAQEFCFQCHTREFDVGLDPHHRPLKAVDQERLANLELTTPCGLCHKQEPEFAGELIAAPDALCQRCHLGREHEFRHMGSSMSDPDNADSNTLYREYLALGGRTLPLQTGQRIGCTTCHTPGPGCGDQGEIFPPRGLRLSLDRICNVCHGF